jgi:hypothetical protein
MLWVIDSSVECRRVWIVIDLILKPQWGMHFHLATSEFTNFISAIKLPMYEVYLLDREEYLSDHEVN